MPLRLLTRSERWKRGSFATRIALHSAVLALLILLPALGLSYTALRSLMVDKVAAELEMTAMESRLRFESRLDAIIEAIHRAAAQSSVDAVLADSRERGVHIDPALQEICAHTPALDTLLLTDLEGRPLERGCRAPALDPQRSADDMRAAITQGKAQLNVVDDDALHLTIAAPIFDSSAGKIAGGLWARIDLDHLFDATGTAHSPRTPPHPPHYRLRLHSHGEGDGQARILHGDGHELRHLVPVSLRANGPLPLAIEVAVSRELAHLPLQMLVLGYLLIGLISVIFVAWWSRRIAREIAAPLAELELTARHVAAGKLDRLPELEAAPHGQDDIRLLTASIHRMIHALQDTQERLSAALETRTLEMERAEADRRLKEHALASSPVGVLIVEHASDGSTRVRYANAAFLRITGLGGHAVIDAHWPELLSGGEAADDRIRAPRPGDTTTRSAMSWTRADGATTVLEISVSPVVENGKQSSRHSVIIIDDVTAQHQATLAIALRDRALQATSNGLVITDLMQPDNPIIYVNPAFEHITQYQAHEVIGRNCRLLRSSDCDEAIAARLRKAIAERKPCEVVLRNRRKDGTMFWNQLSISPVTNPTSGEVTHYVGIQTDITERKANEDLMIEWLSRLDVIFTLSPDPLVCFDKGGRLTYANVAAERVFGTTMGALASLSDRAFEALLRNRCDPAHPYPGLPSTTERANAADGEDTAADPAQDCLVHLRHPQPLILHQTYRYCGSAGTSLVIYYRDVTREAELDRMKSEFLSTAAHELRTPMASIVGFSELLLMRRYDAAKTRELLETINRQAHRLTSLLTDLLDLARIEARRAEVFNFQSLPLRAAIDDTLAAFLIPDARHRLVLDLPEPLPEIRADRAKFQQALLNLLSNALKFSPAGGDVELRVLPHPEGRPLVGVAVRDHGIGMNEEARARAFERFYRSDRSGHIPGTGLGLSLAREIMTIHGGSVTLESEPDVGTCITLWFPLASQLRTEEALLPSPAPQA